MPKGDLKQHLKHCSSLKSLPSFFKVAFRLLVAHVEEGAAIGCPEDKSEDQLCKMAESISGTIGADQLLSLRLEDVFASDESANRQTRRRRVEELIKVSTTIHCLI